MVNGPQNASPIFLQTCLEELRVGASRRELTTRIAEHLSAAGVGELFEQMFARCERNYEAMRPRLVGQLFSFLWAARRGLRESELRELLGTSHEPLPARTWSPVISTLRPHLLQREGLLALTGEAMLKAVSRYYLDSRDDRRAATSTLADYFVRQYPSTRSLEELPWQLLWSGRVGELTSTLVRPVFIAAAWDHDPEDMLTLLATLRFEKIAIGSIFRENHAALSSTLESACAVGQLLFALGENISAEMFVFAAIGHAKLRGDTESVEEFSTTLALIHQRLGKLAEAESRLGQLIDEARAGGRMVQLALHTGNRGAVLREMGRADAALACFLEEEELCRSLGDSSGRSAAIGHLGQIDYDRGHFTEALTRFEDQIMQCRKAGNLRQLQSALGNAAACHAAVDRLEQAMALHGEEEELCRRRGDQEALQVSLGNQVRILQRFRAADYDRAMVLLEEREALAKELGDPAAEAATLLQFSRLYYALNSTQFRAAVSDYAGRAAILADKHGLSKLAAEIALWRSKAISRDI